jgi:hypothetical protein
MCLLDETRLVKTDEACTLVGLICYILMQVSVTSVCRVIAVIKQLDILGFMRPVILNRNTSQFIAML